MLMAYEDGGFKIKDTTTEDARVDPYPIGSLDKAKQILARANMERPAAQWILEGTGPFRVRESL